MLSDYQLFLKAYYKSSDGNNCIEMDFSVVKHMTTLDENYAVWSKQTILIMN